MLEKSCGWWLIWYFLFFCHGGAEATESRPYIDPNITQSSKVMSPEGQPLVINCGINGFPKPSITWNKSLEVMASDDRVSVLSNGSLHFMRLTTGDQGYYYCDGNNYLGQVKSAKIFVEVAYINPQFEQEPNSQYIRGKSRTLPCSPPASHPPANVTWHKDNQPMKYRTGEHAAYILDPAKSIWDLFFNDIQKQDEGRYFCKASNNFAVPMSRTSESADVQIEGQLQWVVEEKVTDYGQNLTLFCPIENCCSNDTQAGWSVGGNSKILDVKTFTNDPKVKYHGTNNTDGFGFVIRNLSEADLNVTYHCNYGFNQSIPTYLLHGDVFKERGNTLKNVPDKDKDKDNNTVAENDTVTESNTVAENNTVAIVIPIVVAIVVIVVGAIIIVYRRKNKKKKPEDDPPQPEQVPMIDVVDDPPQPEQVPLIDVVDDPPQPEQVPLIDVVVPRNIKAKVLSPNRIKVSWLPPTDSASRRSYNIYFNDSSVMEHPDNNYVLEDLIPDTVYQIQVSAITIDIEGEKSPMIKVKTTPLVPRNIKVNVLSPNRIEVSWEPPTDSASITSYNIYFNDSSVMEDQENSHVLQCLIPDTVYQIQVSAITNDFEGENSPMIKVKTSPLAPRNIKAKVLSPNRIEVSWLPPTDSASRRSYNIYFNDSSVMEDQENSHVLQCLIPDTVYQIQVSAITNDIEGEKSPMIEVKTSPFDVYRVCVNFTDILYTKQLDDGNSNEFKSLAEKVQKELTELFVSVPGEQVVVIGQFKEDSLLTIFDLTSRGYDKESVLREAIEKPLRDGRIGNYRASPVGFTFRSISVVYRVDVTFTDILYTKQLDDGNSNEFKSLAGKIQTDLTKLFVKVPGKQVVVIVQFKYIAGSFLTTIDLKSRIYYGESVLRETIEKPLKDGIIGRYKASLKGFNFRAFSGDFHGGIVEKYRTKPKIPKDLLDDQEFLSKLLEECGKNTEGLYPYSSGEIDVVYFPATLLVVVMKYRPKTKIVEEVVNDMSTTLTSQSPSTVVILYHRSVKTAMEKLCKEIDKEDCEKQIDKEDCEKQIDKEDCEKQIDKEDCEKPIDKEDCEKQIEIFRKFIEKHKFYYSASSCLQQSIYKSRQ